jgi:hypothetical protein
VKVQRKDHVSKKNFLYRYRAQNEHLADLAVVSAQWCTPTPCCEDSAAHWLRSHRPDGPAAFPAVGECSPVCVIIPLTAAVDQTDDPEKAHGTTNVGLSEGSSGTSLSAVPVGVPHGPRFDEVSTS